jgi:hypothetical protein
VTATVEADRHRQHSRNEQRKQHREREAVVHRRILEGRSRYGCLKHRNSASPHPNPFTIRYGW